MDKLGKKAKDTITGFEGTITSKHTYLNGTTKYGVEPAISADGKAQDVSYFDEDRLVIAQD